MRGVQGREDNYCVSGTRYLGVNRAGAYSTHVLVPDSKYLVDASGETRVCRDASPALD